MLIDKLLFSDTVPMMMKKSLDFNSSRHLLISNNISLKWTPPDTRPMMWILRASFRDAVGVRVPSQFKNHA